MKKILLAISVIFSLNSHLQSQEVIPDSISGEIASGFRSAEDAEITKAKADSAYMNADYVTAVQIYETLLLGGEAAEVYYNLGNSYYKTDNIAKAILNYERALLLKPGNNDIRFNLEIARGKTVDKVEESPDIFFVSWIKSLINNTSGDTWGKWGIVFFLLFIVSLYFFFFSRQAVWKKAGFFGGILMLVLVICTSSFASYQKKRLIYRNEAIIMPPSVTVRSTPNESGTSLFTLHEGHKVKIKDDTMKNWKEITIEDGKVGWVEASEIEVI